MSRVEQAVTLVPEGNTKIHRHPKAAEIWEVLAMYALSRTGGRLPLAKLCDELNKEFPGLGIQAADVPHIMRKYVAPAVYITPSFVKQGVLDADVELNTAKAKLLEAEALKMDIEAARGKAGTKASDLAALVNAWRGLVESAEATLERYGMMPKAVVESHRTQVNVDLDRVLEKAGLGKASVDASFSQKA